MRARGKKVVFVIGEIIDQVKLGQSDELTIGGSLISCWSQWLGGGMRQIQGIKTWKRRPVQWWGWNYPKQFRGNRAGKAPRLNRLE